MAVVAGMAGRDLLPSESQKNCDVFRPWAARKRGIQRLVMWKGRNGRERDGDPVLRGEADGR